MVELSGTVTGVRDQTLTMVVSGGSIQIGVDKFPPEHLRYYENAQIRIRGILTAEWDNASRQVKYFSMTYAVADETPKAAAQ